MRRRCSEFRRVWPPAVPALYDAPKAEGGIMEEPVTPVVKTGKADIAKRAVAAIIDGAIAGVLGLVPAVGAFVGGLYMLLRDGLDFDFMKGRSVGKQLMKLEVVRLDGGPMDINTSIMRNWPLSLGLIVSILALIPILGWLAGLAVGLISMVLGLIELILVLGDPEGRRFGDRMAGTVIRESVD